MVDERPLYHASAIGGEVLLAEAVARGDLDTLNKIDVSQDLNARITNGMRLMELAAQFKQNDVAQWLIQKGAECTALDAWDFKWKDTFATLLPAQVNRQYGEYQETLLHIAARRNDLELAQLTLQAKPDLTIKDVIENATALNWAGYFGRKELIELIQQYMPSK